jgi:hypothetical protein
MRDTDLSPLSSAVLLPVALDAGRRPCLVFNKRSNRVRQPGDLCFPGGGPEPMIDSVLAAFLRLPGSPLRRWTHFRRWRERVGRQPAVLGRMLAAGLREGFEEMRLNPLSVCFLGPLPAQRLVMFRRVICPLAVWVNGAPRYRPNWEVARVVQIRIAELMDPLRYRRYRIAYAPAVARRIRRTSDEFPAFLHRGRRGEEVLWGATFRITVEFMRLVFGFRLPEADNLPVVTRRLDESYYGKT